MRLAPAGKRQRRFPAALPAAGAVWLSDFGLFVYHKPARALMVLPVLAQIFAIVIRVGFPPLSPLLTHVFRVGIGPFFHLLSVLLPACRAFRQALLRVGLPALHTDAVVLQPVIAFTDFSRGFGSVRVNPSSSSLHRYTRPPQNPNTGRLVPRPAYSRGRAFPGSPCRPA